MGGSVFLTDWSKKTGTDPTAVHGDRAIQRARMCPCQEDNRFSSLSCFLDGIFSVLSFLAMKVTPAYSRAGFLIASSLDRLIAASRNRGSIAPSSQCLPFRFLQLPPTRPALHYGRSVKTVSDDLYP